MFLQNYIYWQAMALKQVSDHIAELSLDPRADDVLRNGVTFLANDIQRYLDVVDASDAPPKQDIEQGNLYVELRYLGGLCKMLSYCYSAQEMMERLLQEESKEMEARFSGAGWCTLENTHLLSTGIGDYAMGAGPSMGVITSSTPRYCLASFSNKEAAILLSGVNNIAGEHNRRGFQWRPAGRCTIPLSSLALPDSYLLSSPNEFAFPIIWNWWLSLQSDEEKGSKSRGSVPKMNLT